MIQFKKATQYTLSLLFLLTLLSFTKTANITEVKYSSKQVAISVTGTSTMHDWEIKSDKGSFTAQLDVDNAGTLSGVSSLSFAVEAESLKSGNKMMDNNTYKALKTGSAKNINFVLSSAQVTRVNASTYQINGTGKLSIAGNARETGITTLAKYNASDKSFVLSGTKKMKMTEYNVKPPTVMMGAIKTGDEISITFNATISQ